MDRTLNDLLQPSRVHAECSPHWAMADDLCGGTQRMRDAKERYLPRRVGEETEDYKFRLSLAFLFPGFAGAIEDLTSRPFEREVALVDPTPLADRIAADADLVGTDLTEHASDRFVSGLKYGVTHVLVDMAGDGSQSKADEIAGRVRPYFVPISPHDLLGVRYRNQRPVQIRFRTSSDEPDGEFGEKRVEQIVVWELQEDGTILVRRWIVADDKKGDLRPLPERVVRASKPFEQIPIDTVWFGEPNSFGARTPLFDLAWKNIEHFQSWARHRYALQFSSAGLLYITGMGREELKKQGGVSIGGAHVLTVPNAQGTVGYAESAGAALGASKDECDDLMRQMRALGQRHLEERSNVTATGERVDESRATSNVKRWIRLLEAGLQRCFRWAALYMGEEIPEGFKAQIFSDFSPLTDRSTDAVRDAYGQGAITIKRYLLELQRRGILSADLDVDEEVEEVEAASAGAWGHGVDTPEGGEEPDGEGGRAA